MKNEDEEKIEDRVFDKEAIDKSIEDFRRNVTDKENGSLKRTNHGNTRDDGWPEDPEEAALPSLWEIPNKNMGASANAGMTRDDSTTATRLLDKNWSPLIIRKYQMHGWPMFIGIICDANLNDLDDLVYDVMEKADKDHGFIDGTIQGARNACGYLSDELVKHYNGIKRGVMEGNIVFWYQDKLAISSAYGDLMTHEKCAMEFYSILNMMPHI